MNHGKCRRHGAASHGVSTMRYREDAKVQAAERGIRHRARDRWTKFATLKASGDHERLILATGRYVGEGFDDSRLDTLFLTAA
jgi:hypothetical protein